MRDSRSLINRADIIKLGGLRFVVWVGEVEFNEGCAGVNGREEGGEGDDGPL